jgi:hypothetical protein
MTPRRGYDALIRWVWGEGCIYVDHLAWPLVDGALLVVAKWGEGCI